jgi:hypothetical protein
MAMSRDVLEALFGSLVEVAGPQMQLAPNWSGTAGSSSPKRATTSRGAFRFRFPPIPAERRI